MSTLRQDRMITDSFSIPPEKLVELRKLASRLRRSKASMLREAIDLLIEKYQEQQKSQE